MNLEIPFEVIDILKNYKGSSVKIGVHHVWTIGDRIFIGEDWPVRDTEKKPSKEKCKLLDLINGYLNAYPGGHSMQEIIEAIAISSPSTNANTIQATMNRAKKKGIIVKKKELWFLKDAK